MGGHPRDPEELLGKLVDVYSKTGQRLLEVKAVETKTIKEKVKGEDGRTTTVTRKVLKQVTGGHMVVKEWKCKAKACYQAFPDLPTFEGEDIDERPPAVREHIRNTGHQVVLKKKQEVEVVQADKVLSIIWFGKLRPLDEWLANGGSS